MDRPSGERAPQKSFSVEGVQKAQDRAAEAADHLGPVLERGIALVMICVWLITSLICVILMTVVPGGVVYLFLRCVVYMACSPAFWISGGVAILGLVMAILLIIRHRGPYTVVQYTLLSVYMAFKFAGGFGMAGGFLSLVIGFFVMVFFTGGSLNDLVDVAGRIGGGMAFLGFLVGVAYACLDPEGAEYNYEWAQRAREENALINERLRNMPKRWTGIEQLVRERWLDR